MPVMLERWNDDKMDALDAKVDGLGAQMGEIRQELREERKETKAGFENMHRTMFWAAVTIIVALLGSGSAIIAALLNSPHS
jgi:hypothetical protein